MKKILILGGTGFAGRILTEELLKTDNPVTLFNRSKRNPAIFPELRKITGDRDTQDIKQIANESWDTVIDFSCMFPDSVDDITDMLKGKVGRYIFVSTVSVYPMDDSEFWKNPVSEDAEILPCTAEQRKDKDVTATYGNKKAECERVLLAKDWLDAIIFRPGLIYGRYDPTDRFYYWLYKVNKQNKVLIPDNGRDRFNSTYSEDFAALIKSSINTEKHNKVYNAVTHPAVSMKEFIDIVCMHLGKNPELVNASIEFLEQNKIRPWMDLPLWLDGMDLVTDNSRAMKDFPVKFHSFEESVKRTIDYYNSLGWPVPKYGNSAEREMELINKLII
jgi:2'-hydroxyisoflavone reductase